MPPPAGRPRHPDVLTPAEWRVLDHVREGRANAEIAVRLGVSVNTVRTHVSSMLAKLELPDRHALAQWDGQPKRRFAWAPPLSPIALGVSFIRGATIAGGAAAAAAVVIAVVLASSGGSEHSRTSMLVRSDSQLIGIDPVTAAPLASLNVDASASRFAGPGSGGLFWITDFPSELETEIWVIDGARIGLRSAGLDADEDGVIQRWTLPPPDSTSPLPVPFVTVRSVTPSPDGRTAYVFRRPIGAASSEELWKLEVGTDQPVLLTTALETRPLHVSPSGRLFIERVGPAALIELDPADASELGQIEFGGNAIRSIGSPDGRLLFVFHGTSELSVVDLDRMTVVDGYELPEPGPISFVASWDTAFSVDRDRLYRAGDDPEGCADEVVPPGLEQNCWPPPFGVQAIDLDTMELLYQDPEHNQLALSPDGRWLVTALHTVENGPRQPYRPPLGDGVKIVDTTTFEVIAHLEPGAAFLLPVVSADSRYAYALSEGPGYPSERRWEDCLADCTTITVIDLDQTVPRVIAMHHYDGGLALGFLQRVP
jgi:DNA-binding CsgD family transcriptional regulator